MTKASHNQPIHFPC